MTDISRVVEDPGNERAMFRLPDGNGKRERLDVCHAHPGEVTVQRVPQVFDHAANICNVTSEYENSRLFQENLMLGKANLNLVE